MKTYWELSYSNPAESSGNHIGTEMQMPAQMEQHSIILTVVVLITKLLLIPIQIDIQR